MRRGLMIPTPFSRLDRDLQRLLNRSENVVKEKKKLCQLKWLVPWKLQTTIYHLRKLPKVRLDDITDAHTMCVQQLLLQINMVKKHQHRPHINSNVAH